MSDQKAPNTLHDNAIGWTILAAIAFLLFLLFWYFFEYEVKDVIRWIRWSEMLVVSLFVGDDYMIRWNGYEINFHEWLNAVPNIPKGDLDDDTMMAIHALAMEPMRKPFMLIIMAIGFWALRKGPGTLFRRKLNLDGLIGVQAANFPFIAPFVRFNPSNQPPRAPGMPVPSQLPLFAEALGPEEWLAYNQIPLPDGKVDEQAAYMAFSRQLGPRWQGWQKLPAHKQILLAAFCLKAVRKRKEAETLLGRVAQCWKGPEGLVLARDSKLLADARAVLRGDSAKKTLSKCNQHGFETTAMLRALQTAREEGGVLAPATFVWLRGFDRALWYPLNCLGRQAYHMEALGAMCHFKAEKMTQRPIPRPKVDDAIASIAGYMTSRKARPIPQLDYSGSKKRGVKKPASGGVKKPR